MSPFEVEVARLREICRDIADTVNTHPGQFFDPPVYTDMLREIEDLAVSGYDPAKLTPGT